MVTTLYLIRHGETEGSETRRYKGSLDVPLSARGRLQAGRVAGYLRDMIEGAPIGGKAAALYSSPLSRAVDTALPIAREFGLEVVRVEGLRERHFGAWEGMSFDEIEAAYPDAFASWARDPLNHSPVGGESTRQVSGRVRDAVEGLIARHQGESLIVVAHGGVNRAVLCLALGAPLENIFRMEQDFGCVNVIEYHDRFPVVTLLNALPPEGGPEHSMRVFG